MTDMQAQVPEWSDELDESRREHAIVQPILRELLLALQPHPRGLRRWSVMRAIRVERTRISREVPLKFESDVESVFRKFSAAPIDSHVRVCKLEDAPFCRPRNTAGEVWALRPGRLDAATADDILQENTPKQGAA